MSAAVMYPVAVEPGQKPAAVLAVIVHLALFAFLVFGLRWSSKPPGAVVVELWAAPVVAEAQPARVEPKPEPRPEPKPVARVEPRVTPPPKPVAAKKPDIAVEKEKKPVRKEEPKPVRKEEPKQVRKEEPKLQIDARTRMQEQLARETQSLAQDRQKREVAQPAPPAGATTIDAGYANRIKNKIKGNIVLPGEISGNPEAIFDVIQLPTGEVLSVKLRRSSGYRSYDDAVERAILKSSPLPRPDSAAQTPRQLELKFRPQE